MFQRQYLPVLMLIMSCIADTKTVNYQSPLSAFGGKSVYSVPENRKTIGREPISLTDKSLEVSLVTSAHGKELNIEKSET
ncbi:hypothetical protein KGM_202871 [Danaus plexippus plexippus]|uniref:Uncharacterized protein n=1 Tax=Danaus plexippus plexippus TaxID=278856 RepID=A0A212F6P8_DANPL|nr:hypothetical protein KGM_202871 [Danaus plexippus plexippus]